MEMIKMNKPIVTILVFLLLSHIAKSQTENVGIGTNTPDNSAVLHVSFDAISGPKGLLIPRMTSLQRASIPAPIANGLLIFNTDTNQFEYYDASGTSWLPLLSTGNITLNSGSILVGDATNVATPVSISGDALLNNAGVVTIQDNSVDGSDISITGEVNGAISYHDGTDWIVLTPGNDGDILAVNSGLPSWQADNSISTVLTAGNILVGDATNAAVSVSMSGDILITETGLTTIQDDAVDGSDISLTSETTGSLTYFNGTDWIALAPGTDGQSLSLAGGVPVWTSASGGGNLNDAYGNGSAITLAGGAGSVVINGSLDSDAALEVSNSGTNGIALQVNSGLSRFGNSYTATVASGDGDLIVDNVLEVGGDLFLPNILTDGTSNFYDIFVKSDGKLFRDVSSRKYKDNIRTYDFDFKKILNTSVKEYNIKGSNIKQIGLIAEELDSLDINYLVVYDKQNNPDAVHYNRISLYLLEVVKEQQNEIDLMREELEKLKAKVK